MSLASGPRYPEWTAVNHGEFLAAVTYGDNILLWELHDELSAYYSIPRHLPDPHSPRRSQWSKVDCSGAYPPPTGQYAAQVISDKLYFLKLNEPLGVYVLDLQSNDWKQLQHLAGEAPFPLDTRNLPDETLTPSWAWQDKIYFFGGYVKRPELAASLAHFKSQLKFILSKRDPLYDYAYTDQCVAFNTTTESWEWPKSLGEEPPCPRANHACIVDGDYMLLYGGYHFDKFLTDLHVLHMPTHTWTKLSGGTSKEFEDIPQGRNSHTLTLIGGQRALLLGGWNQGGLSDCWVLSWSTGASGIENVQWKKWKDQGYGKRIEHLALHNPETSRVLIFGGDHPKELGSAAVIEVGPQSLFETSMKTIIDSKFDIGKVNFPSFLKAKIKLKLEDH